MGILLVGAKGEELLCCLAKSQSCATVIGVLFRLITKKTHGRYTYCQKISLYVFQDIGLRIPVLQDLYNRLLAKGNTRMQARCAVMRKMLLILRGMVIANSIFEKIQKNLQKTA